MCSSHVHAGARAQRRAVFMDVGNQEAEMKCNYVTYS